MLPRTVPPLRALPRAVAREAVLRSSARRMARELDRAGREGRPVLAGPWLSEVGPEVEYWIPMLRRLAARHGLKRDQITAVSRGGSEPWYREICGGYAEIFDFASPDEVREWRRRRVEAVDTQKQLEVTSFDRELLRRAAESGGLDRPAVAHPLLMFGRLRYLWAGQEEIDVLADEVEFARLPDPGRAPQLEGLESEGYVAVKAYFSDCFPETADNRRFATELVERLLELTPVVLLGTGVALDDHEDFRPQGSRRLHDAAPWMTPRDNLAVQSTVVAGARALFSTYGGFSYLGPLYGVRTASFFSERNFVEAHLDVIGRAAREIGSPVPIVSDVADFPLSEEALSDLVAR